MHRQCCGCCSLKTGTIIIGVLRIVFSVFFLIETFTVNIKWPLIFTTTAKIIFAIYYCIIILFCTLLVIGSIKKNAFMMLPWMVLDMMMAVGLLVSVFYNAIVLFINDIVPAGLFSFFFGLAAVMIYTYMWLVVYSHFQELRIEKLSKRMGPYGKPYNYRQP